MHTKEPLRIGDDGVCPVTKLHCDDECCPPGAECNVSDTEGHISNGRIQVGTLPEPAEGSNEWILKHYPVQDGVWPSRRWTADGSDYADLSGDGETETEI